MASHIASQKALPIFLATSTFPTLESMEINSEMRIIPQNRLTEKIASACFGALLTSFVGTSIQNETDEMK
jgi:hypothetical protein